MTKANTLWNYPSIPPKDKNILRDLAKHQLEIAHSERNIQTINNWYKLNNCDSAIPLVHIEIDTFAHEVIPKRLKCVSKEARELEAQLYSHFLNFELFGDDRVVSDKFEIPWIMTFTPFNLPVIRHDMKTGGHEFISQIKNLAEFSERMNPSSYSIDQKATMAKKDYIDNLLGDILPTQLIGTAPQFVLTQDLVHLMSMQDMFLSIYDYPDAFKKVINQLADDYIHFMKHTQESGILLPTRGHEHLCQGSFCYNTILPKDNISSHKQIWGFMDSQETVGISPDMFHEFIFPAYKKIADRLGRVSYGCCEPIDPIWEKSISTLNNLGKVSISPWANEVYMGEKLRNKKIVYHRKPSPNYLGVEKNLDEVALRKHILATIQAAKGCTLEITQRDVYTIHHNENKVKRYIQIIKEVIENEWSIE